MSLQTPATPTHRPTSSLQKLVLTDEQARFLKRHRVPKAEVFDASGLKRQTYGEIMKAKGYRVAVGVTPCAKGGHVVRNRFGTCLQCNPATLAFERRYEETATVYVARSHSTGLCKVGVTIDLQDRERSLNSHGYAGAMDWRIVFRAECDCAARVELTAQNRLAAFYKSTTFVKNGQRVQCKETFSCSADHAIGMLRAVISEMA